MDPNSRVTPEIDIDHWVRYDWLTKRKGRPAEILGKPEQSEQSGKINTDDQGRMRVGSNYINLKDVLAIYPRGRKGRPIYCEVVQL